MALIKGALLRLFASVESGFEYAFGQRLNPFTWLGAFGWYFYWITAATGIYLYIFFDTGIVDAYASVEYIPKDPWYAAGVRRSLHRYASDALVIVVILHILREFAMDRLRGKHFFAWLTGVPLLAFIYICGISGYWLVWDKLAQYIALATSEWLDALPLFAEPIANNFLDSTTLGGRFFTLMVFIHIFAPLFMLVLMWVHVQRHSSPRVNLPKPLALGTMGVFVVLSLVYPAVSQGPADNCNGCTRCFDDCPFGAISMVPRSDGSAYDVEPLVATGNCTSCGICAGSCPTSTPFRRARPISPGIELPDKTIGELREQLLSPWSGHSDEPRVFLFACDHSNAERLTDNNVRVIKLPCAGMLPPSFVDFALSRSLADGVLVAGCAENDCFHRLGNEWTMQRMRRERDPRLRQRVPLERVELAWLPPLAHRRRVAAVREFSTRLQELDDE